MSVLRISASRVLFAWDSQRPGSSSSFRWWPFSYPSPGCQWGWVSASSRWGLPAAMAKEQQPKATFITPPPAPLAPASPAVSLSSGTADLWRWGWVGEKKRRGEKAEDTGRVAAVFLEGICGLGGHLTALAEQRLSSEWLSPLWAISTGGSVLGSAEIELNFHATIVQELNLATDPEKYTSLPTFLFPEILPQSFEIYLFQEAFLTTPSAGDSLSWILWGVYWLASKFNAPCLFLQEC